MMEAQVLVRYREGHKWRLKTITHTSIDNPNELRELGYLLEKATQSYQEWRARQA